MNCVSCDIYVYHLGLCVFFRLMYTYLGNCGHRRTERPEISGTGTNSLQIYRRSSFYGNTRVGTTGTVCMYPTEHNLKKNHLLLHSVV